MPTLFISYKRDDKVAVLKIVDRLKKEFYFDIWLDALSIPGGEDWRAEIRKGVDRADAVLLMLTPDACASPQVLEEVQYAQSAGRKIIPLQIKRVSSADLEQLGVERLNYIDFNTSHDDSFAWERLLESLPEVLERDKRLLNPEYRALHEEYLRSLFTRYGKLSLSYLLDASPKERVSLFDVYVPLFLGTRLSCEIKDGKLIDWWVRTENEYLPEGSERPLRTKTFPGMTVDETVLNSLVARMADFATEYVDRIGDGEHSIWRLESEEAPALAQRLVITGAPGSGKSTLMKHLALCMAGDMLSKGGHSQADLNNLGFWPLPAYTPVFVELRGLVRSTFSDSTETVTLEKFFGYIASEQLKPYRIEHYLDDLRAQMRDGDVMFFLDGLDEVPDADTNERREQIKALAHALSEQYPKCRICITSRPYAYAGDWQLDGFGQVTLTTLDTDRLEELALRLFRVVLGQEGAEQEAESFKQQMEAVPPELRGSPLFFTLMAAIWLNNLTKPTDKRLPVEQGDIYRECVEMLLQRWTRKDAITGQTLLDTIGLTEAQLRQVLELLAYQVHREASEDDDAEFTGGNIVDVVRGMKLRRVDYDSLTDALAQRAGIIFERAPNRYQYAHRSFQEHLAACHLVADERYPGNIAEHLRQQPGVWRNVMELLPEEAKRHERDLWQLVKGLLPPKGSPSPENASDPAWYGIFYAARLMIQDLPATDDLQEVYRPRLQKLLVALIEQGALAVTERAEMGRILAELDDPRPGVGVKNGLPEIAWSEVIPSGEYPIGGDDGAYNPLPAETYKLERGFQISQYPITNAQFEAFIGAEDGYRSTERDWFEGLAADESDRQIRENPRFHYGNHPRVDVNWYQAMAFCRWLSWKLGGGYDLDKINEWVVRLPTEKEWEIAARGPEGLFYPYGNEFNAAKGNTDETGIKQTSAVGIFPDGVSWCGAYDLSGNVYDWCLTHSSNPAEHPEAEDLRSSASRVLRGGSWYFNRQVARAASRDLYRPGDGDNDVGVRVVFCPIR